ncbi:MAG: hypothetical protein QXY88_01565 [Candidatus Bathyarchaeia archaeon]
MKLEDYIVIAGLLIFIFGNIASWPNLNLDTTIVGLVLIVVSLIAGSETLKKSKPEPMSKNVKKK